MMKKHLKIIGIISGSFLSLLILLYLALAIFIKSYEKKITAEDLINETNVELSDEQLQILSYISGNQKESRFHKNPLFVDLFSPKDAIALLVAKNAIHVCADYTSMDYHFSHFATKRYVSRHLDYKLCCNYLCSIQYYGMGIYGLKSAAQFYFDKDYENLSAEEFVYLCYLPNNPVFYIKHNGILKEKAEKSFIQIFNKPGNFSDCNDVFYSKIHLTSD